MLKQNENQSEKLKLSKEQRKTLKLFEKQKKKRGTRERKEAPPASAQRTLNYQAMFENGLCEIVPGEYSRTIQLSDLNYKTARTDDQLDIFGDYCELLNACDVTSHLQLTIMNQQIDVASFKKDLFYELKQDEQNQYREELNQMLQKNIDAGQSNFVTKKYLTVSTSGINEEEGSRFLERSVSDIVTNFEAMEVKCEELSGLERLKLMHELLKPKDLFHFKYEDLIYSRLSTHSVVAPSSFNFGYKKHAFEIGEAFGQILFLKDYPSDLSDKLIGELMDIPESLVLALHIQPTSLDESQKMVKTKKMFMESEQATHQQKNSERNISPDLLPYELKDNLREVNSLLADMTERGQKLFLTSFYVYVRADSEKKLEDIVAQVKSVGRKNNCGFSSMDYLQEKGLNSVLPIGKNFTDITRTLTTANVGIFIPFTAQDLHHPKGKFYGVNKLTKNAILVDRQQLYTPSGYLLGSSGSGKGVAKKYEMITTLLKYPDDEIISIDPEDEDIDVGKAFGAQMIKVSPNTNTYLNIMELTEKLSGEDDPVKLKTDFLLTGFENLIGGSEGLSPSARSMIDRVTRYTYADFFQRHETPTLKDWFGVLKEQPEEVAQSLALELEVYIEGSLGIFAQPTNVELNNRFVIYNTKQLGSQLKTFGMMVVLDQVWNRVVRNREKGIRTWIYIDEMQLMLNDPYCENYFFELWSRVRKWGAIPTGITQNVETLLLSDKARRSLGNSEFIIMLKQAKPDRDELEKLFGLSPRQTKYLTKPEKGAGLLKAGNAIVPFSNTLEKNTKIYEIVTTDPKEKQKLLQKQLSERMMADES
ncbi:hypothetical protein BH739_04655 [Enterococcus casseliflavus]|nr:hypothetical protein BH739_04655 [Enterococcus casseliflavus]